MKVKVLKLLLETLDEDKEIYIGSGDEISSHIIVESITESNDDPTVLAYALYSDPTKEHK